MFLSMIESLRKLQHRHIRPSAIRFGILLSLLTLSFVPRAAGAQGLQPSQIENFGSVAIGSSSTTVTISVSDTGTSPTTISSVMATEAGAQNKDFVMVSQNCVTTLQPGDGCNVTIKFSPLQVGLRTGALSFIDSSNNVSIRYYLYGIGLGPQMVFSPVTAVANASFGALSPSSFKTSTSVYDGAGNLYFNDYLNGRILELSSTNTASVVTSQVGNEHSSMAIDGAGDLYISSPTQGMVRFIVPGVSNTIFNTGSLTLTSPSGVAIDGSGFIYIADSQTNKVARVSPDGSISAYLPLTGLTTPLLNPYGLAVDGNFLYIADTGNGRIVEVSLTTGNAAPVSASNTFSNNYGVAVDAAGNLVVSNAGNSDIEELTPTGTVFAFAPDTGNTLASTPLGLNISTSGDIVSSDADLGLVKINRSTGSRTFPTSTKVGFFDSTDGYENLTVQNSGNQAIQFASTDPAFSSTVFTSGPTNTCPVLQASSTPLAVGSTCTYSVNFTPSVVGANDGTLTVQGTAVGTGAAISGFSNLVGTGISQVDALKVVATPATTTPGTPVSFTVSALEGTTVITSFTGTVTFSTTPSTGTSPNGTSYTFTTADAGVHTFTNDALFNTPGTYTISATFNTVVGTSNSVVVAYPSQTTLTSSVNPSLINNNTTLTATVSSTASAIVPTGTITFLNGTATLGSCTLSSGQCTLAVSFSTAGTYPLTAVYGSDTNFSASTSSPALNQVVTDFTAVPSVTSSINPSFVGQQTMLTATVAAAPGQPGAGTPTGSVTFKDGTTTLNTVNLVGGTATLPFTFTTPGNHSLTVTYSGNTSFGPATSTPAYIQVVNDYAATASVTSSINPSFVGQQTTLTATVTAVPGQAGSTTPAGTVTFKDGTTTLGTVTLVGGIATLPVSFAISGAHNLTVIYNPSANYATVTSTPAYVQTVNQYAATASVTSSINPSFVGQQTTLTATITPVAGQTGSTTPTGGTVTFKDGGVSIGTGTLVNGVATLLTSFTPSGAHNLTVTYGSASYATVTSSPAYVQTVNQYTSQVTLTSSVNPSLINTAVTLTATVSATPGQTGAGTPTGTVTFKDGATTLGTGTLASGVATFTATFTTLGNHSLTAVYGNTTSFSTSTSTPLIQVVDNFTSQVVLNSSINPSVLNQQTMLTATVSATPGQGTTSIPSGTVTFKNGTATLGTATLINGAVTFPASFATAGSYQLTVVYSGDNTFIGATSPAVTQVVNDYTSVAALTSSIDPSFINQQTTLTATVSAKSGQGTTGTPTGTVTFKDGNATLGSPVTLVNGVATLSASFTTTGNHSLTVVYSGDNNFVTTISPPLTQVVNGYTSQVVLTSSINPSVLNQQTTLTATVSAAAGQTGAGTPTGTVTFKDGNTILSTVALTDGVATLPASFTTTGSHSLTAVYSGDNNFLTATSSPALTQNVTQYASQTALTSSINPSFLNQQTTLTATITPVAGQPGAGTPTGSVTFKNGSATLGTATLTNGIATLLASFTAIGNYTITAVYSGDNNFNASISNIVTQVVSTYTAGVTLTSSANPAFITNATTLTATIAVSAGQGTAPAPGGFVTFLSGTTPLGVSAVVNGQATLQTTFSTVASYSITAVYSGDANFPTTTSPAFTQVVEDFSIALASGTASTQTVLGGYSTTYTFTLAPIGGSTFAGPIAFGISGFPVGTVATFSPATLASGATGTNVTLTVKPPATAQARLDPGSKQLHPRTAMHYAPVVLALLVLPFASFRRRRPMALFLWLLLCASAIGLTGCLSDSSSGYYGNNPGTYTLSVTGNSGTLSHTANVTLTVQ